SLSCGSATTEPAKCRSPATTAKKCFEKVTKTSPAEFKFDSAILATPLTKFATARRPSIPAWWWLKSTRLVPLRTELIVLLPLLRIAQHFVGFVDLFELFLRRFLVLGHVRMVLAGELAERRA